MRTALFFLLFMQGMYGGYAQVSKIDSLNRLLSVEKADSSRVSLMWQLAEKYHSLNPNISLKLAQQALLLAKRIHYTEGESRSLAILATAQYLLGNYPKALTNYMLKLKIEEGRDSPRNYISALSNIGLMYILLGEYDQALSYLYRADQLAEATGGRAKSELKYNIIVNIGETYYRMKNTDSAALYFNKALAIAKQHGDRFSLGAAMLGTANVLALKKEYQAALAYYFPAYNYLNDGLNKEMLCEVSLGMARVYESLAIQDTAFVYGQKSLDLAKEGGFLSRQLDATVFLSQHFKNLNKYDLAYAYLEQATTLKENIIGQEKIREAANISNNEKIRQIELAEQKLLEEEMLSKQLQQLVIAICIPMLFLLTLFISRIRIHRTFVRYMGIISLLFLFEYIMLLLHPMVAEFAHHIPIIELLIFVSIAAIIVPLHHWLEHLLIKKLTETEEVQYHSPSPEIISPND